MTALDDLTEFGRLHVETGDIDPAYPVLSLLLADLPDEVKVWRLLVYVAHYNLSSAMTSWRLHPEPVDIYRAGKLPCGTERRGLRGGLVADHLATVTALAKYHGGLLPWLTNGFCGDRHHDWLVLQANLQQPWGNGRWAAYKTGELLMEVVDLHVSPTDAGHGWSSGPRKGLARIYPTVHGNTRAATARLDEQTDALTEHLAREGVTSRVEQVETILCDFHSLAKGSYYVGHDIDQQREQAAVALAAGYLHSDDLERLDEARAQAFLPQHRQRETVDRPRRLAYRETGVILAPDQEWP